MGKAGRINQTVEASPFELSIGELKKIPSADSVGAGDLSALGMAQCAFEAAAEKLPEDSGDYAEILSGIIDLCGRVILGEVDNPADAQAFIFTFGSRLTDVWENQDEDRTPLTEKLASELDAFFPQEKEDKIEAFAVEDKITLNSKEDLIIYTEFIMESSEHLENIEGHALELENAGPDIDLINEMFRCFHSMKGAAGFLGLSVINRLCHEVETMLDRARKMTLAFNRSVIDVLLASIDAAKKLIGVLHMRLERIEKDDDDDTPFPVVETEHIIAAIKAILENSGQVGPEDVGSTYADPDKLGGILVAEGSISEKQLVEALELKNKPVGELLVDMGAASREAVDGALAKQAAINKPKVSSIKVDTGRLDRLMDMVGELVIAESLVDQDSVGLGEKHLRLSRNISNLGKITRNLQEQVMAIRLVPLKQTFQKMFRLVRDTACKTGKNVQLEIYGEDTEIDKTVVEEIADPMVHLLRNAVDHGIEAPADRVAAGKPEEGKIKLNAYHEGGNVVIEITDDGKGIDPDRILLKAIEKGLATDGGNYSEAEIYDFIFLPGFSTHSVATDISGRGVGMDVVKRNIERLGGRVDIQSAVGKGSTFYVRLPLTMAIVDGMVIKVGDQRYVLPTLGIQESIHPKAKQIHTVSNRGEMIMVRGDLLPLVRLHQVFEVYGEKKKPSDALVIIIDYDGRQCGLLVDELVGQQQVVVKSLGAKLKGINGVSGGCILGDGRVGLILDLAGLLKTIDN